MRTIARIGTKWYLSTSGAAASWTLLGCCEFVPRLPSCPQTRGSGRCTAQMSLLSFHFPLVCCFPSATRRQIPSFRDKRTSHQLRLRTAQLTPPANQPTYNGARTQPVKTRSGLQSDFQIKELKEGCVMQYFEFSRCQNLPHVHITSSKGEKKKKRQSNTRVNSLLEGEDGVTKLSPLGSRFTRLCLG